MEYLQYVLDTNNLAEFSWKVLNLIINGIPSIRGSLDYADFQEISFKPYYKWNTFNTTKKGGERATRDDLVLNLIINGIPSILKKLKSIAFSYGVLNLIINGIPSILPICIFFFSSLDPCFKPYYKWNTFNT